MRLYRTPAIGPRAAGVSLVIIGVTVLVLLGMFSPAPAGAHAIQDRCVLEEPALPEDAGIVCEPLPATVANDASGEPVITQSVSTAHREDFLFLAVVTMAGGILLELRPDRAR